MNNNWEFMVDLVGPEDIEKKELMRQLVRWYEYNKKTSENNSKREEDWDK